MKYLTIPILCLAILGCRETATEPEEQSNGTHGPETHLVRYETARDSMPWSMDFVITWEEGDSLTHEIRSSGTNWHKEFEVEGWPRLIVSICFKGKVPYVTWVECWLYIDGVQRRHDYDSGREDLGAQCIYDPFGIE